MGQFDEEGLRWLGFLGVYSGRKVEGERGGNIGLQTFESGEGSTETRVSDQIRGGEEEISTVWTGGGGRQSGRMAVVGNTLELEVDYFSTQGASVRKLEKEFGNKLGNERSNAYPAVTRGSCIYKYFPTADERLLEYDIDKVVYEQRSQFQKILIVHSRSLGNLLLLDDLQNLSESDLIYTETLMQRGKENYRGKEIVILGGGDGALLHELLKEEPKYVVMIEIDELVMKAAAKYLRSCCGDVLDTLKGDNYEIVVDDCVNVLNTYIQQGKSFDYIFGDLTDIPISSNPQGETWDFIRSILSLSMEVLKPEGKYMTHGNGASCPDSLKMFERQLTSLKVPVEFSKCKAFVPSFMEDWVFYQIWKKN
uniref:PABS domain-containing protein n=1 Tax=Timema genevievae TaxID=629358 RepID=A0A7R9K5J2_TIMGE|nr:unnamed protein product [Timema genevievae]